MVCLLGLALSSGCASIMPITRLSNSESVRASAVAKTASEREFEVEDDANPTARPRRRPLLAAQANREQPAFHRSRHDAATRQLIESELRDALPKERSEWLDYLSTIESSMVPIALESRRIQHGNYEPIERKSIDPLPPKDSDENAERGQLVENNHNDILPEQQAVPTGHAFQRESEQPGDIQLTSAAELPKVQPAISSDRSEQAASHRAAIHPNSFGEATDDESTTGTDDAPPEEHEPREWSGRIRSLADWDRNPLRFGREDGSAEDKKERRNSPLTSILPHPFQRHQNEDTTGQPLERTPVPSGAVRPTTVDPLRVRPGAELWEEELTKLVSLMEAEASAQGYLGEKRLSRKELRQQVALRMLYLVNDQPQRAMQPIPGLEPLDQEFWSAIFLALSDYLNSENVDPLERSTNTVERLRSATRYLQTSARLQVREIAFCTKIDGFGMYEPFESYEFSAGQPVLLYCDLRNFDSQLNERGEFVTRLKSTIEIYRAPDGTEVLDRNTFEASSDSCKTIRTDYYNSYRLDLPPHLEPGRYLLKLILHDELASKTAFKTIEFSIR